MSMFITLYIFLLQSFILRFLSNDLGRIGTIKLIQFNFFVIMLINYSIYIFNVIGQTTPYRCLINLGTWFKVADLHVSWLFSVDSLSFTMGLLVVTISCFVHVYSITYLTVDPYLIRFMSYLSLFTSFMLMMVFSLNLLVFFIGWEGIGVCSYLLISFWYTRIQAIKAALKALLINRIGDFFFLVGVCFCFKYFKTIDIDVILFLAPYFVNVEISLSYFGNVYLLSIIAFCFSMAAIGKSAQLGLHTWLPDAMEGPTPVSALIHAATMVTAGIYLLLRLGGLLVFASKVLNFLVFLGALTAFVCALVATVQFDIKKIIAYSTCSQLGYMFLSVGLTNFYGSFYHLLNHAFFKALLFLTAGAIIHSLNGEQDVRKMGGLVNILPFYYFSILISSLSMIGFFFFSGFYSKEAIINTLYFSASTELLLFSYWLSILTASLTAFYSIRLIYLVFFGQFRGSRQQFYNLTKTAVVPFYFKITLIPLIILSIFSGYLLKGLFNTNSLFFTGTLPVTYNQSLAEFLPFWIKLIPVFASFLGIIVFYYYYEFYLDWLARHKSIYVFISDNFFFSSLMNIVGFRLLVFARSLFFAFDKGMLEIFGPSGAFYMTKFLAISLLRLYIYENIFFHLFFLCFNLLILLSIGVLFFC